MMARSTCYVDPPEDFVSGSVPTPGSKALQISSRLMDVEPGSKNVGGQA